MLPFADRGMHISENQRLAGATLDRFHSAGPWRWRGVLTSEDTKLVDQAKSS
jgi:hypothetical protein